MSEVNFPINRDSTGTTTQPQLVDGENLLIRDAETEQDWFVLAQKLRHHNQDLVRTIVQLEQTLAESQDNLHQQLVRSQTLETLIDQQNQQLKETQHQINQIIKELQGAHKHNRHQQELINKLSDQLQQGKEEKSNLQSQINHLEQTYREQCYLILSLERDLGKLTKSSPEPTTTMEQDPDQGDAPGILDPTILQQAQPLPFGVIQTESALGLDPTISLGGTPVILPNLAEVEWGNDSSELYLGHLLHQLQPQRGNDLAPLDPASPVITREVETIPSPHQDDAPQGEVIGPGASTEPSFLQGITGTSPRDEAVSADEPVPHDTIKEITTARRHAPSIPPKLVTPRIQEVIAFPVPRKNPHPQDPVTPASPLVQGIETDQLIDQKQEPVDPSLALGDNPQRSIQEQIDAKAPSTVERAKDGEQTVPTIEALWESLQSVEQEENAKVTANPSIESPSSINSKPIKSFAEYLDQGQGDRSEMQQDEPRANVKASESAPGNQGWNYNPMLGKQSNWPSPLLYPQRSSPKSQTTKRKLVALPKLPH